MLPERLNEVGHLVEVVGGHQHHPVIAGPGSVLACLKECDDLVESLSLGETPLELSRVGVTEIRLAGQGHQGRVVVLLGEVEAGLGVWQETDQQRVSVIGVAAHLVGAASEAVNVTGDQQVVARPQSLPALSTHEAAEVTRPRSRFSRERVTVVTVMKTEALALNTARLFTASVRREMILMITVILLVIMTVIGFFMIIVNSLVIRTVIGFSVIIVNSLVVITVITCVVSVVRRGNTERIEWNTWLRLSLEVFTTRVSSLIVPTVTSHSSLPPTLAA